MSLYRFDESYRKKGFRVIAGIDEAGRGCIAGPVVAGAVILGENPRIEGIRDSKKLSPIRRKELFWRIMLEAVDVSFGIVDVDYIEKTNILDATRRAMIEAINGLEVKPELLLIDAVKLSVPVKQVAVVRGDDRSASIAAASIIAKVLRDWIMEYYDSLYPEYDFKTHKGYCTRKHLRLLNLYGLCPIHRKGFKPVMNLNLPFCET